MIYTEGLFIPGCSELQLLKTSAARKGQAFIAAKSHLLNNALSIEEGKIVIDPAP